MGELWKARLDGAQSETIEVGQKLKVIGVDQGLTLVVEPIASAAED